MYREPGGSPYRFEQMTFCGDYMDFSKTPWWRNHLVTIKFNGRNVLDYIDSKSIYYSKRDVQILSILCDPL